MVDIKRLDRDVVGEKSRLWFSCCGAYRRESDVDDRGVGKEVRRWGYSACFERILSREVKPYSSSGLTSSLQNQRRDCDWKSIMQVCFGQPDQDRLFMRCRRSGPTGHCKINLQTCAEEGEWGAYLLVLLVSDMA